MHVERKPMMRAMSLEPRLLAVVKYLLQWNFQFRDDLLDQARTPASA
jgi:hypothetical protein